MNLFKSLVAASGLVLLMTGAVHAKDELTDKKILTDDVYAAVKDLIIAKQKPAKK